MRPGWVLWALVARATAAEPPAPHERLPGRWYPDVYRTPTGTTAEARAQREALEALGYLGGSEPVSGRRGVVRHDRARTSPGYTLYSSGHASVALLVDLDGEVLHTWQQDYPSVFPAFPSSNTRSTGAWRRVALRPTDGHLLAVWEGLGLVHLDADSHVVWATANRAHHDVRWRPDGSVLTLTRALHASAGPGGRPLLEDFVTVVGPDGDERRRVSVLEALQRSPWAGLLSRAPTDSGDLLHTNAVFPLPDDQRDPAGGRGPDRVLLSLRHLDALAVLDLTSERLVWVETGTFRHQHDAELSATGALWLFDNRGGVGGTSRALALRPWTLEPLWSWAGPEGFPLSSDVLGAVQELPNGNVLVTESTRGHLVEVTRAGVPVWEFLNPHVTGPGGIYVAAIFEGVRLPPTPLPWLRPGSG